MNNVRPLLGGALGADMPEDVNQDQAIAKIILSAFTNAPAEHYEAISKAMSQRIEVDRNGQCAPALGWSARGRYARGC